MTDALLKAALRLLDAAKGDHDEMTQTTDGHYEFELDLAISGFEKALDQPRQPISALAEYLSIRDEDPPIDMGNALERLRFFCSLSMPGQDWLDVEPFFDDLEKEQAEARTTIIKRLPDGSVEVVESTRTVSVYPAPQQAEPVPHPDTVRLAYLYSGKQTKSNLLVDAAMRLLNGESLTLEEARAAIDDAMKSPLEVALDQQAQTVREPICRTGGRCQYAIDHGAEGLGHCPAGKCVMPDGEEQAGPNEGNG
jgi:hypothetical protein